MKNRASHTVVHLRIEPHVGVGPIKLGMTRQATHAVLRQEDLSLSAGHATLDYFCDNAVQVEYENEKVSFIGVSPHERIYCTYRELNVFDMPASKLFAVISDHEPERHVYDSREYLFPHQVITVYDADEQYDRYAKRQVYGQVGLGNLRYLEAVRQRR